MATLKRKHDAEVARSADQASKRQRVQDGSQFYAAEPETIENDVTMPDALRSPVLPAARRRRKASISDPGNHQVTYLVGRNKPGQSKSRQAVVNLHGRRKDVEQCIAFLEKYSPSDNNNLIARLTQSPTMSVVNALEIRSWSTDVKTPEYCADLELWQRREEHYSPPILAVSPYPRPVSIVLRYPDGHVPAAEPPRVLRVPDFDELQEGLMNLSDTVLASLHSQLVPTLLEKRRHPAVRAVVYAKAQLDAIAALKQNRFSNHDLDPLMRILLQNFGYLSQFSMLHALHFLFRLLSDSARNTQLSDKILNNIAHSCQNRVLASIARSSVRRDQFMPQRMTRYVLCVTNILSKRLSADDGILMEYKARLATMYGSSDEKNSALSVVRDICETVETSMGLMDHITLYCCLANVAQAYLDLHEYEEAIKNYMLCIENKRASGWYRSHNVAFFWMHISFCYYMLSLQEEAYHAATEAVEVALRIAPPLWPVQLQYLMVQRDIAWINLVAHRRDMSNSFEIPILETQARD